METTAAYADQRLTDNSEQTEVRDRHLDHYHRIALGYPLAMMGDVAAGVRYGPDRANVAAVFEWAATHDQWTTAAQLLLGLFRVFNPRPVEGIELVDRCIEALPEEQHDLAGRLHCNKWILCIAVADYRSLMTSVRWLRDSKELLHQVYGYAQIGVLYALSDLTKANLNLRRASEVLDELPPGPDIAQAAAAYQHCEMQVAFLGGEHRVALDHAQEAARLHRELGFESDFSAAAWMVAAICSAILGEPDGALELADRYSQSASAFATGEEFTALVHIALGDLEAATQAAKTHARIAVSGRITQQATDSLLVVATLAHAKDDRATAQRLLLGMGTCRITPLIAYSRHLADQLDLRTEFEIAQRANRTASTTGVDDAETLRQEMTRRGWT